MNGSLFPFVLDIEGRVRMDMLDIIRRDHKLKSYTLNSVSAEFLKEQKEDVHYSQLADLFLANADSRRRVAVYCLKVKTNCRSWLAHLQCPGSFFRMLFYPFV